jgi:hypothetical protein
MCCLFGPDTVPTTDDVQSLPMTTGSGPLRTRLASVRKPEAGSSS